MLEEVFITRKYAQRKILHTLKIDVFELQDNKNIGKYELFSLDQASFISDPSQILILQYPFPTISLNLSSSLSISPLFN